jgi:hypothetical protein
MVAPTVFAGRTGQMNAVETQEQIAFHESAHAVVRHCFRHPVKSVEIGPDTGCCVVSDEWAKSFDRKRLTELARRELLFEHIICCCAGKAAMDRWHGYKASTDESWRASDDFRQAFSYALEVNGDRESAESLVQWLLRRTEVIVERQWPRIQRLAAALCDSGAMNVTQIRHVLRGA